ncbi:MAG: NYN domain-containing protein [Anaerolineaceae bacterium]|nr:NYN domain-containing protein [Anaerolineaceae bacterium]
MAIKPTDRSNRRFALLIDGDNAQPKLMNDILTETGKYGSITIRRIYGDWTTANMNGWKDTLHTYAVQPIQQFRYTIGKNATDSAMIIDAMDILYSGTVNSFCLVSSDSDYTRLATRLREMGIFVMGIGKKTTPRAFVNACEVFLFTENFSANQRRRRTAQAAPKTADERSAVPDPIPLLESAFDMVAGDDGWAALSDIGNALRQLDPSFDPRTYGHSQLLHLIRANKENFRMRGINKEGPSAIIYVKLND